MTVITITIDSYNSGKEGICVGTAINTSESDANDKERKFLEKQFSDIVSRGALFAAQDAADKLGYRV